MLVGIGVSTPEQAAEACEEADGVIVGTALVRRLLEGAGPDGAAAFVAELRAGLDARLAGNRDGVFSAGRWARRKAIVRSQASEAAMRLTAFLTILFEEPVAGAWVAVKGCRTTGQSELGLHVGDVVLGHVAVVFGEMTEIDGPGFAEVEVLRAVEHHRSGDVVRQGVR